jgi:hypothetical protein
MTLCDNQKMNPNVMVAGMNQCTTAHLIFTKTIGSPILFLLSIQEPIFSSLHPSVGGMGFTFENVVLPYKYV